ncbi:hypothetical protein IJM86_08985 [bacterium]|nr:hypothetical protein [bacterium]
MDFFFEKFSQLLHEEISEMDFLSTGDVTSDYPLYEKKKISSRELFTQQHHLLDALVEKTLVIADEKSFVALSLPQQEEIQKKLKKSGSLLLLC